MARPTPPPPTPDQKAARIRDQVLALDVKRVADWIQTLIRTVKAMRMYLPNNPTLHKFQGDLEGRTWSVLKEIGDITLTVQQFDFLFENYSVYHNAAREDSLAFRFYADGVREITIKEGLEPQELRGLLDVLKRSTDGPSGQDDVVTLLWERDFRHVEYIYIPLDELIGDASPAPKGREEEAEASSEPGGGLPWPGSVAAEEDEPDAGATAGPDQAGAAIAAERSDDWASETSVDSAWDEAASVQFRMTDEELSTLEAGIREEEARPLGSEVLEIVAAILESEEEPAGFLESAVAFQRFIELAIEEADIARANALLARLKTIAAKKAERHADFAGIAEQVIREIGRPSFLAQAAPTLNAHPEIDPAVLTNFLIQLGSGAAPAVCDLLGQVNHVKHRRALCEALATSCRDDVEILIGRLGDSRWYVIRNVVYVLGRIAHQGVERALDRALHHEDVRVRKEAVRALGKIESPTSRAYLISAFRDADAGVRVQAATTLAAKRDERAAQSILQVIGAPEFPRRDLGERQAFFEALGRSGSDALVPQLSATLTKGTLFRAGNDEDRYHAALALAWLGTPAALAVLNRELSGKREPVRKAVEAALTVVRNAGMNTLGTTKSEEEGE
ncbi:MAG TPA: HEAT repeat domain-containing protein [Candidatus Eisenbacteria bacterium]|nr:HEAT repeat domain-containing protein [Candidatus Eisenbacteria bacterium]